MAAPVFRHAHRVTYAECTVGNHIYHSRYLDLLEAARGEFLRSLGPTVLHWQNHDAIFPVVEARVAYKAPARYDDLLAVEVWLTKLEKVRVNFGHRITDQHGKLIFEAETFHVCTTQEGKPRRVPEGLAGLLEPHVRGAMDHAQTQVNKELAKLLLTHMRGPASE